MITIDYKFNSDWFRVEVKNEAGKTIGIKEKKIKGMDAQQEAIKEVTRIAKAQKAEGEIVHTFCRNGGNIAGTIKQLLVAMYC
jgi:hypothetical protein